MNKIYRPVCAAWLAIGLAGCSTVTPYSTDIASKRLASQQMTAGEAVEIIRTKAKVSSDYSDHNGFALDEKGFSTVKTTKSTKTEWRDGKPVSIDVTNTNTRNVPWGALRHISPYLRQYKYLLGDSYKVAVQYTTTGISNGIRAKRLHNMEFGCKTYQDLVDVVAALRLLSGDR